ncbi:MAG: xanthine dehydrogenase family protein molybdopterin-binding subunit [Anaerolineales bacterium]|nr:xanthine dehydrogenase family protein molybdopterin-binding subunit [Anaerolineales bacterium]HJO33421.1 xanthine dehydrogenase family protein molybdopterin-binding subunit [Anaerolineales bacterium]
MSSAIGASAQRLDATGKVTGKTCFPGDLARPDMLHMKILFAGRPHARMRSIDTRAAQAHPGVVAVFTAADVPANEYGLINADQPVLVGIGSEKAGADVARFVGDQVALVVAESESAAAAAHELIEVTWEDLPVVNDPRQSMRPDAFPLFAGRESNIVKHNRIRKGEVQAAWPRCAVIVEAEYRTPSQEHAFLQPEAGLAYIDAEGRVTVEVAGQWLHEERDQIAHALGLSAEKVRVIHPAIGGAFGGREDLSVQIVLAVAVWRLEQRGVRRPVKIIWTREESIIGHHKRHPYSIHAKWGADGQGRILAAEVELVADAGAYEYTSAKVLSNATLQCTGPYDIPNVSVDAYAVYTNNLPSGAFRGFGAPQGAFAAESQVNRLAAELGLDAVEMRRRNLLAEGSLGSFDMPMPKGVTIRQVVEECAQYASWAHGLPAAGAETHIRRGRGFACAMKNVGFSFGFPEQCGATMELHGKAEIERVVLRHAGADCGQGAHTALAQMAAETCGVPLERVELLGFDTANSRDSGSASASRMTFMAGNSIRGAGEAALRAWRADKRPAIGSHQFCPRETTAFDPRSGRCDPNITYGYVAQVVDVEIDIETGQLRVMEVVCVDDVGRAINPQQIEGQIEGAVVQAHGYAVLEDFVMRDGHVLTPHLSTYLIPTAADTPARVQSVILENADPQGPWGARGMAEMPFIPYVPAVIAAVHAATGVWFNQFPLTPERVLVGLGGFGGDDG